jgi:hypothetical protein
VIHMMKTEQLIMDNIRYPCVGGSTLGARRHHPDLPIARRRADTDHYVTGFT